ncbi:MAG: trypsin-like serine protease [Pseudomonadota bacterium]
MPAQAIEFGKPDTAYESVGALAVYFETPFGNGPFGFCSGFVISDRAFVTAAHCLAEFPHLQHVPQAWAVTMEPGSPENPILPPGVFTELMDFIKFPIDNAELMSPTMIHTHPDYDPQTQENDVAVLEFPAGTFKQSPVKLARPWFLNRLKALRILQRVPIGVVGYGGAGFKADDMGVFGLYIPGHRNRGFTGFSALTRSRLFLEPTAVLDSRLLSGDSGSPQFILDRAVSLSSVAGVGEQRLDIPSVRRFLAPFIWRYGHGID